MCQCANYTPPIGKKKEQDIVEDRFTNTTYSSLSAEDRLTIGMQAYCRAKPMQEIASDYAISRQYVHTLRNKAEEHIRAILQKDEECKAKIERTVISLALNCHASLESIRRSVHDIFAQDISIGEISGILKKASEKAEKINASIDLGSIKHGANDEIFQGKQPVLTGIDAESTYIYLMTPFSDRSGESWQLSMESCKDQGLNLAVSVSDAGSGLLNGISAAFPQADLQSDVFHVLRDLAKEVEKLERSAHRQEDNLENLRRRFLSPRSKKGLLVQIIDLKPKVADLARKSSIVSTAYQKIHTYLGFCGLPASEVIRHITSQLEIIESAAPERAQLIHQVKVFRQKLPSTVRFIYRLFDHFQFEAKRMDVPAAAFALEYRRRAYPDYAPEQYILWKALWKKSGQKMYDVVACVQNVIDHTVRASSLVENLNGRIRPFMNAKRRIHHSFFPLLQLFLNTKHYRRSRKDERCGKSPLEMLTGLPHPPFLTMLGY